MKLKTILVLTLAALCCAGATARSKKKKFKAQKPVADAIQPVPADSFSYAVGVAQSTSLKQYLTMREGVDTLYLDFVVKGLTDQLTEAQEKQQAAYAAGLKIAKMNRDQIIPSLNETATGKKDTVYTDLANFTRGLCDGLLGKSTTLTPDSAMKIAERQFNYQRQLVKNLNTQFLEKNKENKDVKVTPSGLQYKILAQGTGALPTDSSEVEVNYEGKLIDGTVFDSSYSRKKPATFRCNQVIKGWTEALKMMPEGSTWELYIPYELAYGERGAGQNIPPFSTLIFKVELLKVKQK